MHIFILQDLTEVFLIRIIKANLKCVFLRKRKNKRIKDAQTIVLYNRRYNESTVYYSRRNSENYEHQPQQVLSDCKRSE